MCIFNECDAWPMQHYTHGFVFEQYVRCVALALCLALFDVERRYGKRVVKRRPHSINMRFKFRSMLQLLFQLVSILFRSVSLWQSFRLIEWDMLYEHNAAHTREPIKTFARSLTPAHTQRVQRSDKFDFIEVLFYRQMKKKWATEWEQNRTKSNIKKIFEQFVAFDFNDAKYRWQINSIKHRCANDRTKSIHSTHK